MEDFDASNKFLVGGTADEPSQVCILAPPAPRQLISKHDALNLACWLLVISGATQFEVAAALTAVEST